jgi:ABC-type amino acid transport substrate-binding protein
MLGTPGHLVRRGTALFALGLVCATACSPAPATTTSSSNAAATANDVNTIQPGVLKVAIEPYMPYTAVEGGELVGLDSDITKEIAKRLNLTIDTGVTDFKGMLAGVQSRRYDITVGGIAWSKERQQAGLFTDPPYYSPPAMAVHGDKVYSTVKDFEGKQLGTVSGYVWVKSIQAVPNANLHAYPDANGAFSDLGAGRIDVAFLDPLLIIFTQQQRPDLEIKAQYLTPPTAADLQEHPDYQYFAPYMTGFYIPKEEPKLESAATKIIDDMYKDGAMAALVKKWGGDPNQFLKPSAEFATQRRGADRPNDWNPPSI